MHPWRELREWFIGVWISVLRPFPIYLCLCVCFSAALAVLDRMSLHRIKATLTGKCVRKKIKMNTWTDQQSSFNDGGGGSCHRPVLRLIKRPGDCAPLGSNNNTFSLHQCEAKVMLPDPWAACLIRTEQQEISACSTVSILLTSGNSDGGKERSRDSETIMEGYILARCSPWYSAL